MDIIVCERCGRMMNYLYGPKLCVACKEWTEEKFKQVKAYILENTGRSINTVAFECDVPIKMIKQWLREERLQLSSESAELICDYCGQPIRSGKMCETCKNAIVKGLSEYLPQNNTKKIEPKKSTKAGMRYLNNTL